MKAPIQIRREDVANDIRALAELMKVSITDAVAEAVRVKLESQKAKLAAERAAQWEEADRLLQEIRRMPRVASPWTDEDLYDEDGLPKSPWS